MKKILIVGAGACGLSISRLLSAQGNLEDVIIVTGENINEHKDIMQTRQLTTEPILYTAPPMIEDTYIPTKQEIEQYHPFAKFIGNGKRKKGRW